MAIRKLKLAHNEEQRRLLVAQRIQLQFIIRRQLTQFGDIEHRQPCAAGNQNAFRCFSRCMAKKVRFDLETLLCDIFPSK